jgi:hypothetical protein
LPRLASSITSGAASKPATARTVQKGLGYATAKRKSGSARDRKGSGASRSRSAVRCRASPA